MSRARRVMVPPEMRGSLTAILPPPARLSVNGLSPAGSVMPRPATCRPTTRENELNTGVLPLHWTCAEAWTAWAPRVSGPRPIRGCVIDATPLRVVPSSAVFASAASTVSGPMVVCCSALALWVEHGELPALARMGSTETWLRRDTRAALARHEVVPAARAWAVHEMRTMSAPIVLPTTRTRREVEVLVMLNQRTGRAGADAPGEAALRPAWPRSR